VIATDPELRALMLRAAQKLEEASGYVMVSDLEYAKTFHALSRELRVGLGLSPDEWPEQT
jgi:hypothetical protein